MHAAIFINSLLSFVLTCFGGMCPHDKLVLSLYSLVEDVTNPTSEIQFSVNKHKKEAVSQIRKYQEGTHVRKSSRLILASLS